MKTLVLVPSKQRPEVFEKYTKPFIADLGLDALLILEKEDYKNYNFHNKLQLEESNQGTGYYSLQQMWSCLPLDEEILRARKRRDETEMNRRNGIIPNQN